MGAATSAGERRAILQAIGPVAKRAERKIGTDQNGRVLIAKYIEVEPYPWLEKLEKSVKKLPQKSRGYLTAIYRGKMPKNRPYIPLVLPRHLGVCKLVYSK